MKPASKFAVLIALIASLPACSTKPKLDRAPEASAITGKVMENGVPLGGQEVQVRAVYQCQLIYTCSVLIATLQTDQEGVFNFKTELKGEFTIRVGSIGQERFGFADVQIPHHEPIIIEI